VPVEIETSLPDGPATSAARSPRSASELSAWLALHGEPPLEPERPIVDAHHHLWNVAGDRYSADDFCRDATSGHSVQASIAVECGRMYRSSGPALMRPVGEVEYLRDAAAAPHGRLPKVAAAIVGFADLASSTSDALIEAEIAAADGRLRGIRHSAIRDLSLDWRPQAAEGMLADDRFRRALRRFPALGLVYDAWQYFHQLPALEELARACSDTTIVINHCGGVLGVGRWEGKDRDVFEIWSRHIELLAACPNVMMKIGGLGMTTCGFPYLRDEKPPSSHLLAQIWRPYVETCISAFGVERCMFESNFPPDRQSASYTVLWNALKRLAKPYSDDEKHALFVGTSSRVYRLDTGDHGVPS
jgi:predicted TIM-barrel fold metal-dependent hydrolase